MGTPTYPLAIKVFSTYHDYSDVIFAASVNELHDEVVAIETLLGTNPFVTTPYDTVGGAVQDLYLNKAPITHTHNHHYLLEDGPPSDDHPQYILTDGTRAFTGPVGGQWAIAGNQLVPLSQLQSFNYINVAQAEYIAELYTADLMSGAWGGPPLLGPSPAAPTWKVTGGLAQGCTNGNGDLFISFGSPSPFVGTLQSFVATKLPVGGGHACPPYNYIEAQLTLVSWSLGGAWVRVSHDYSTQPGLFVACSWVALGV